MYGRSLGLKVRKLAVPLLAAGFFLLATAAVSGRAGATVITASPIDFATGEQSAFSGAVATFTDNDPNATPASFTTSINWGTARQRPRERSVSARRPSSSSASTPMRTRVPSP